MLDCNIDIQLKQYVDSKKRDDLHTNSLYPLLYASRAVVIYLFMRKLWRGKNNNVDFRLCFERYFTENWFNNPQIFEDIKAEGLFLLIHMQGSQGFTLFTEDDRNIIANGLVRLLRDNPNLFNSLHPDIFDLFGSTLEELEWNSREYTRSFNQLLNLLDKNENLLKVFMQKENIELGIKYAKALWANAILMYWFRTNAALETFDVRYQLPKEQFEFEQGLYRYYKNIMELA